MKVRIYILLCLVALFMLILSIYNLSIVSTQMSDENIYSDQKKGVVFIQINAGGVSETAGIRVGDLLLKINGDTILTAGQAQKYLDSALPGESLIYTIEREGRTFDVEVNLALAGLRIFHVGSIIAGLMFIVFGLFIGFFKPENRFARLMSFASLSMALLLINVQVVGNAQNQPEIYRMTLLMFLSNGCFFVPLFAHALLYFPEKKFEQIPKFWLIYSPYMISGIVLLFIFYEIYSRSGFNEVLIFIPMTYTALIHLIFFRRSRKEYKKRVRAVRISGIILFGVWLFTAFYFSKHFSWAEYLAFFTSILPLAFFYTTIRYRAFDIYLRIRLSMVYSAIQILLLGLFLLSIAVLIQILPFVKIDLPALFMTGSSLEIRNTGQLNPETQAVFQKGYLLLIGIVAAFVLFAFKNRMQKWIDRLFYQQKYDYRQAMRNFGELLSSFFNRETICEKSVEQIHEIMKLKATLIALSSNGNFLSIRSRGEISIEDLPPIKLPPEVQQQLVRSRKSLRQEELHIFPAAANLMNKIYCATPIVSGSKRLEAILFTGEKLSESPYNNDDLELLTYFADHLGSAFERAHLYEEMTEKERLQRELEIAREIQRNSLPSRTPDYEGLQIHASLTAAYEVGGDYYDYLDISKSELGIIVGDVVGKGTSAAFHMSKIQGFLRSLKLQQRPHKKMLEQLNQLIRSNFDPNFFFTALYAVFDTERKTCLVCRLGHNGLIYYQAATGQISSVEPPGIGFGLANNKEFSENLTCEKLQYRSGDIFVFLTDGYIEAMNAEHNRLPEHELYETITREADHTAETIMSALEDLVMKFSGRHPQDDATGVVVKIE